MRSFKRILCPCCIRDIQMDELHFMTSYDDEVAIDSYVTHFLDSCGYNKDRVVRQSFYFPGCDGFSAESEKNENDKDVWVLPDSYYNRKWRRKEIVFSSSLPQPSDRGKVTVIDDKGKQMKLKKPVMIASDNGFCYFANNEAYRNDIPLCPMCHQKLPLNIGIEDSIAIALGGLTQNAKTAFIFMLVKELSEYGRTFTFRYNRRLKIRISFSMNKRDCDNADRAQHTTIPDDLDATDPQVFPLPLVLHAEVELQEYNEDRFVKSTRYKYMIMFRDIAGEIGTAENTQNSVSSRSAGVLIDQMVPNFDNIIFCADSKHLNAMRQIAGVEVDAGTDDEPDNEPNGERQQTVAQVVEMFERYISAIHRAGNDGHDSIDVAVMISKSDIIHKWIESRNTTDVIRTGLEENVLVRRHLMSDKNIGEESNDPTFAMYYNHMTKATQEVINTCTEGNRENLFDSLTRLSANTQWFLTSALGCDKNDSHFDDKPPRHLYDPLIWAVVRRMIKTEII